MLDNYQIFIDRYFWNVNTDIHDINFFSSIAPENSTTIDIKPYIIDIGNLEFSFDTTDSDTGTNSLYFETSDMNLTVSGFYNDSFLVDFFKIFQVTKSFKWQLRILDLNGILIYKGLCSAENIDESFNTSDTSEEIKIQVFGFEKEFKEYFGKIGLVDVPGLDPFWNYDGSLDRHYKSLLEMLQLNFDSGLVEWNLEAGIEQWNVIESPNLWKLPTKDVFIRSGYGMYVRNGMNKFQWLQCLCNTMGWLFFYWNGQFCIRNRSSQVPTRSYLDYHQFIEWNITKDIEHDLYDNIIIKDGYTFMGDACINAEKARGQCAHIINNFNNGQAFFTTNTHWWSAINGANNSDQDLHTHPNGYKWQILSDDNTTAQVSLWTSATTYTKTFTHYDTRFTLYVDGGDSGAEWSIWSPDRTPSHPNHFSTFKEGESQEISDGEMRYKGNVGSMLFKFEGGSVTTYLDYITGNGTGTGLFKANYLKYFVQKQVRKIGVLYNAVIPNPLVFYAIQNVPNEYDLSGDWDINSISIDFNEETTKFILQGRLT